MTTSNKIEKKDLMRVFWRSFSMEWSWNYERQANMAYAY
ncbi:MAG: PTS system mannose/fructose/sorbose family transporter subunit IID, partial [Sarcina sp.]